MLRLYATVAQSVEQLIRNQQVAGSSPASSSKNAAVQAAFFEEMKGAPLGLKSAFRAERRVFRRISESVSRR